MLRIEAGRHAYDRALTDLIGELSTRRDTFTKSLGGAQSAAAPIRHQTF